MEHQHIGNIIVIALLFSSGFFVLFIESLILSWTRRKREAKVLREKEYERFIGRECIECHRLYYSRDLFYCEDCGGRSKVPPLETAEEK